jgi:hypothetical protein
MRAGCRKAICETCFSAGQALPVWDIAPFDRRGAGEPTIRPATNGIPFRRARGRPTFTPRSIEGGPRCPKNGALDVGVRCLFPYTSPSEVTHMGEPMDRSRRIFMKPTSFEKGFPTLEQAIVEYTESDFVLPTRSGSWYLRDEGGLMSCGNPSCRRGGYELDREVSKMVRTGATENKIKLYCRGDEGSPKGRKIGRRCQRSIDATIKLKYNRPASVEEIVSERTLE